MSTLALVEFLTVDGVMQGLGSPEEDTDGGFAHGGWGAPYAAAMGEIMDPSGLSRTKGYLFGRRTYEKMAQFWPHQPAEDPMAAHLNDTPKHVASRSLTETVWSRTQILPGDALASVAALKEAGDGDLVVLGSGVFARQLMRQGLVDELRLFLHPLLLGTGKRLFGELPAPRPLELRSVTSTTLGTIAAVYAVGS